MGSWPLNSETGFADSFDHYAIGHLDRKYRVVTGSPAFTTGRIYGNALSFAGGEQSVEQGLASDSPSPTLNMAIGVAVLVDSATLPVGGFRLFEYIHDGSYLLNPHLRPPRFIHCWLDVLDTGALALYRGDGVLLGQSVDDAVPLDAWWTLEVRYLAQTGATGAFVVAVNGGTVAAGESMATTVGATTNVTDFRLGNLTAGSPAVVAIDDLRHAPRSETVGPLAALAGIQTVRAFPASGDGDTLEWGLVGAASHAAAVGDVPADDDAGYIDEFTGAAFQDDLFTFTDMPLDALSRDPYIQGYLWLLATATTAAAGHVLRGVGSVLGSGVDGPGLLPYELDADYRYYGVPLGDVQFGVPYTQYGVRHVAAYCRVTQIVIERISPSAAAGRRTWASWLGT